MKTLFVSTSFGRSSGFMARRIQLEWQDRFDKIFFLFSNTGLEHEETLIFGKRMEEEWGLPLVWLEAVVDPRKGHGIRHRVTDYANASRNGEPFADHCAKEGLPGPTNRKCSDRLKLNVMASYRRSLGYKRRDAYTCVGIRSDEADRINPNHLRDKILYPLITDWPVSKEMVYRWWQSQDFDLQLSEEMGNCIPCYQKTWRKLMTAMEKDRKPFEFIDRMETQHGHIKSVGNSFENGERRKFYRDHTSASDLMSLAAEGFTPYVDNPTGIYTPDMFDDPLDRPGVCNNGCIVNEAI